MCGRFVLEESSIHAIEKLWPTLNLSKGYASYNIAPSHPLLCLISPSKDSIQTTPMQWGLVPSWAKEPKMAYSTINARIETAFEKPTFRTPITSQRCLIPLSGFYEWVKDGTQKTPYYFYSPHPVLFFAGIWDIWEKDPQKTPLTTCSLLTTKANDPMAQFHPRMPILLSEKDTLATWLNPEIKDKDTLQSFLDNRSPIQLSQHPVSLAVNKPSFNNPQCISLL